MRMSLLAAARYQMAIPEGVTGIDGAIIFPAGVPAPTLLRRKQSTLVKKYPHLARRLLDPQLYLAELNPSRCRASCVNLASYGWFGDSHVEAYDSKKMTQADWRTKSKAKIHSTWTSLAPSGQKAVHTSISVCVATQKALGCEALILPSPLTVDASTDYSAELGWLDEGLRVAAKLAPGIPRLTTIAVSDTCLRGIDPTSNSLLDLILDQVVARNTEGAYVVLEQANEHGYYCSHPNTIGSLLRLTQGLKGAGVNRVVVAFAGVAGLLATCVGADDWCTGWYRGERRLRLADHEDQTGRANPTFYSHGLASEFHLQLDLDRAVE